MMNGFPSYITEKVFGKHLSLKYENKSILKLTVPKDNLYIKLPFLGRVTFEIKRKFNYLLKNNYPQFNFKIVFNIIIILEDFYTSKF